MLAASRGRALALLARVPSGTVTTPEALAAALDLPAQLVVTLMGRLSDDERQIYPWHRVIAAGGGIGRGPYREAQFAKLVREGVAVSPAGVVQDMARVLVGDIAALADGGTAVTGSPALPQGASQPPAGGRSRGMKSRPVR